MGWVGWVGWWGPLRLLEPRLFWRAGAFGGLGHPEIDLGTEMILRLSARILGVSAGVMSARSKDGVLGGNDGGFGLPAFRQFTGN